MEIKIQKAEKLKTKPDENNLGFGQIFTDHMFVMDYATGKGWFDPRIVPYGAIEMEPSTMVLHYGQAIFEGMKAFRSSDDRILIFRPERYMNRMNVSSERLCIPAIDPNISVEAVKKLVMFEREWVPSPDGTALYIRPFIIAMDPYLGVRPSNTYKFMIILSPVGAYYPEGINPVRIYVEDKYVRAAKGGVGFAKTPGNYAASLKAQMEAKENGFTQVLWLDGAEKKYIEEVGTMNVFFKINGEVITPPLEGSILGGITRESTIELLKNWGIPVTERNLSINEVYEAGEKGLLEEAFGTGTAAVISPIGELSWGSKRLSINSGKTGELSSRIYDAITTMQKGAGEDPFGWVVEVK